MHSPAIRGGLPLGRCTVHAEREKSISVAKTKGIVQAEEAQLVLGRPVRSNPYSIASRAMKAVALFLPALAVLELVQKL